MAKSIPQLGTHFDDRPKTFTYSQISAKTFLHKNYPMKIKVSQEWSNSSNVNEVIKTTLDFFIQK